jgi:hypothetical protein
VLASVREILSCQPEFGLLDFEEIASLQPDFYRLNFQPVSYKGRNGEDRPAFEVTKCSDAQ